MSISADGDSDLDEMSDGEINKLVIVTQTPHRPKKHEGYDRTGDFTTRAKMSQDLAQVINDGLYYYERGLTAGEETDETETDDDEGVVVGSYGSGTMATTAANWVSCS